MASQLKTEPIERVVSRDRTRVARDIEKSSYVCGTPRMKRLIPVLAAAFLLLVQTWDYEEHAQDPAQSWPSCCVASQRISMGVGKSRIVELPQDAAEIFVAKPRVAN